MPVKVRCPECREVLKAPDKARGRALKCPHCSGRVPVPSGKKKRPPGERPRRPRETDPQAGFLDVDLRQAEDRRTKICPKCATVAGEEDVECRNCGVNIETGALSERQRRKQTRGGPDPEEFFDKVWTNSKKFVGRNKFLVLRTLIVWTITATLAASSLFIAQWSFSRHVNEIMEAVAGEAGVDLTDGRVHIKGTKENPAVYMDNKYYKEVKLGTPAQISNRAPTVLFWRGMGALFQLGFGGWAVFLTLAIVRTTLAGEKRVKRLQSDFFNNITLGIRFYFWPVFVSLPLVIVAAPLMWFAIGQSAEKDKGVVETILSAVGVDTASYFKKLDEDEDGQLTVDEIKADGVSQTRVDNWIATFDTDSNGTLSPSEYSQTRHGHVRINWTVITMLIVLLVIVYGLPLLLVPPAAIHMAQQHTYPAWLLWHLLRGLARTAAASLAVSGMLIGSCIVIPVLVGVGIAAGWASGASLWRDMIAQIADQIGYGGTDGFLDFVGLQLPLFGIFTFISMAVLFAIIAWPAVFVMRAIGVYGLYFSPDLGLVVETTKNEPAGAGPRFLAYMVDSAILAVINLALGFASFLLAKVTFAALYIGYGAYLSATVSYFVLSECGQARATPGKWSLGLIVLNENNTPMKRNQGMARLACAFLSALTLYIGFIICLFDPEKKALHDKLSNTKCVFKGDDERS